MSATTFGTNDALTQQAWSKKLSTELMAETYVGKFIGKDDNSLIQKKSELKKDEGDTITFGLRAALQGEGRGEGETLEGNEESLQTFDDKIIVNELRHAVKVKNKGSIDEQRVSFGLRKEAKSGLRDWFGERYDQTFFNHICGYTPVIDDKYRGNNAILPPSRIVRPNNRDNDQSLADGDAFTLQMVLRAKNMATVSRGGSRRIRPLKIRGKKMFVMFIHPDQEFQLRASVGDEEWAKIQLAALQAGDKESNPIFTDAIGIYNNVIFHSAEHITQGVHSADNTKVGNTRRAVLCGAQAAAIAGGKGYSELGHKWVEELFDYKKYVGVAVESIFGFKKTRFDGQDHGTVVVSTHSPNPNA